MEDLVLDGLLRPQNSSTSQTVERPSSHAASPRPSRVLPKRNDHDEASNMVVEIPLSRPESPLSDLGLVRGERNALQNELRVQQDVSAEAKRSVTSLRKLALRLAVRISVKEAKIASHAKALSRARMTQYLAQNSTLPGTPQPQLFRPGAFPLSPPQSPVSNKPLPALPRWDSSGRVTTVRFSPHETSELIDDTIQSTDERLSSIDASRTSLKEELEATQRKLAQLFESQAILRERYNAEGQKARSLDAECQQTHAKIFSLEQSKQQIEDEARHLHSYVQELEQANQKLRRELMTAKVERHNIQGDLSKLQSSKLTLEHQLQVASRSKDTLESQLQSLRQSSETIQKELEQKLMDLQSESKESTAAVAKLETEREKLDDDLRVTKFRLSAAVDLEDQLRSQLSDLKDCEFNLEHDLQTSRGAVAKLEEELLSAYDKLAAMDKSVDELSTKLKDATQLKVEHENAVRLTKASRDRIKTHLLKMEKNKSRVDRKLRATRSELVLSTSNITAAESNVKVLQGDLARVQQRNEELEALVEKAETTLTGIVEKTNASVSHLEAIVADTKILPFRNYFSDEEKPDTGSIVEQQLLAHQKEIDTLHQTNAVLVNRLDTMTRELNELASGSRPPTRMSEANSDQSGKNKQLPSRPGSPPEVLAAEELYELEMKQLRETRATFNRVVKTLQSKSAELELLGSFVENDHAPTPPAKETPTPIDVADFSEQASAHPAKGGEVAVMRPRVVSAHYASSIIPDLEIPRTPRTPLTALRFPSIASDIETLPRLKLHKSHSESALKTLNDLDGDKSFWRIGDIRTIAAAGAGSQRKSMCEDLLRRSEAVKVEQHEDVPRISASPAPSSPTLGRMEPKAPLRPVVSAESLVASSAALPSPTSSKKHKGFPLRPMHMHSGSLPRSVLDKELPRIPRRPVGGYKPSIGEVEQKPKLQRAKTMDDLEIGKSTWSLFPKPSKSLEIQRPATATGYFPFNAGPRKWATSSSSVLPRSRSVQELRSRQATPEPTAEFTGPAIEAVSEESVEPKSRGLRLRRSLSLLRSKTKRTSNEPSSNDSTERHRIRSMLYRSLKLRRDMHEVPEERPTSVSPIHSLASTTPTPTRAAFSNGANEPVGIYDPISKMWLTPQTKSRHFGVFDPESEQWMAPSPRTDSLRRTVSMEANIASHTESNPTAKKHNNNDDEDEEHGALSLAEKLEMIRYKPLKRTFSTPAISTMPRPSTAGTVLTADDSLLTTSLQTQKRRPWKPGQLLGLKEPPKDNGLGPFEENQQPTIAFPEHFKPPFARTECSIDSGSGYMSFESDYEGRARDWKRLLRSVNVGRMLKRNSTLRRSPLGSRKPT